MKSPTIKVNEGKQAALKTPELIGPGVDSLILQSKHEDEDARGERGGCGAALMFLIMGSALERLSHSQASVGLVRPYTPALDCVFMSS